jgi:hypothetical protein
MFAAQLGGIVAASLPAQAPSEPPSVPDVVASDLAPVPAAPTAEERAS